MNLIDVLHDVDARLLLTSERLPAELLAGDSVPPDAVRARSRLALLQFDVATASST